MSAPPLILPYVAESDYAAWAKLPRRTIYPAERVECRATTMFPQAPDSFYDVAARAYDFPEVTLTEMRDVVVRGRSDILTAPGGIVRHDLITPERDILPEFFYGRMAASADFKQAMWQAYKPFEADFMPEAAAFTDAASYNYAHWLTEVLPRLNALVRDPEYARTPLIVNDGLHANLLRSIELLAPDAPLRQIYWTETIRVGRLLNVSPTGYVPFKLKAQGVETISHGRFSRVAIADMAERLRQAVGVEGPGASRPRLFVRRQAMLRAVDNEAEIADALHSMGFQDIEPGSMTFDEQVRAFANASVVVCATGAAATNLLFCQPDCPVVILLPRLRFVAYWYWRSMAPHATLIHVSGEQIDPLDDPFHPEANDRDFKIELQDVLDAVATAIAARP